MGEKGKWCSGNRVSPFNNFASFMTPGLGTTDMAIEIRFLKTAFSQLALLVLVLLGGGQTALAAPDIEITEMSCMTSPGGYWWAIEQANATPGRDTIQVRKSFTVDDCKHFPAEQYPDLHVTESVDIVGNGFTVYGNVGFVDANGNFNRHGVCPLDQDGYLVVGYGGGFIDIGQRNVDNQGIEVTVTGLNMSRLTGVAMVRKNAKLRIENSLIQDTYSVYHQVCNEPIIFAQDHADLTLVNTKFERISVPEEGYPDTSFPVVTSAIKGTGGDLIMDRVTMDGVYGDHTTAIGWFDGTAKIVSSQFVNSSGIWVESGALDFVNSSYFTDIAGLKFKDNFLLGNATTRFQASTFWWGVWGDPCDPVSRPCAPRILGFYGIGSSIRFEGSAIGAWDVNSDPVLAGNPTQFSSDIYTWIQPRQDQNAAVIKAILPNVLTAPPGLHDSPSFDNSEYLRDITPLIPGLLVEAVPNAGGVNRLISPIDNLPIATDVLGNPRIYSNNTRNIGAVQNAEAPVLKATGGDAKADLSWNNPTGTKTGYEICTSSSVLSDPFTGPCTGTSTSVSDPTKTAQSIGSLTNGSPYWFVIRSVNDGTPGIWSNVATATPSGVPGTPVVTATAGDGQAELSWTTPPNNGSPITGYVVKYRPKGDLTWTSWIYSGTGITTTISSLTNGLPYEFEVSALNRSPADIGLGQGQGLFGFTAATPAKPLSLAYPTPIEAYETNSQTINPAVANLLGTPTYSLIAGSLPSGLNLNADGTISGTPALGSGSASPGTPYPVQVQLSQSGPPAQTTTASLTINVIAAEPSLQLIYPDLLNVPVGSGPYSLAPSFSGFSGQPTFTLVDGSLPPGLSLDSSTGIISGTPTTATSGVFTPTIRAEFPGQNPEQIRQNVLEIEILPLLSYPPADPTLGSPFTITPSTSPAIVIGSYSVIAGTLPPGLTLDNLSGRIHGTPTSLFSSSATIEFTTGLQKVQANVLIAVKGYSITLSYPPATVTIGRPVNLPPTTTGTKGTPVYSLALGQLPPGLTLNPSTGVISGTPTGPAGNYPVEVKVTDPFTSTTTPLVFAVLVPVQPIPTLSEWGMLILASLMVLAAGWRGRRFGLRYSPALSLHHV